MTEKQQHRMRQTCPTWQLVAPKKTKQHHRNSKNEPQRPTRKRHRRKMIESVNAQLKRKKFHNNNNTTNTTLVVQTCCAFTANGQPSSHPETGHAHWNMNGLETATTANVATLRPTARRSCPTFFRPREKTFGTNAHLLPVVRSQLTPLPQHAIRPQSMLWCPT